MVKRVKGICKFARIRGKYVRVEFCHYLFDNRGELCNLFCECDFLFGFKLIAFLKGACFFKNAAGTGRG